MWYRNTKLNCATYRSSLRRHFNGIRLDLASSPVQSGISSITYVFAHFLPTLCYPCLITIFRDLGCRGRRHLLAHDSAVHPNSCTFSTNCYGLLLSNVLCSKQNLNKSMKELSSIRVLRPSLVHIRSVLVKNHTYLQRHMDARPWTPMGSVVSCSFSLFLWLRCWCPVLDGCGVRTDHKCFDVSTLV
jgi:hypothetical protein